MRTLITALSLLAAASSAAADVPAPRAQAPIPAFIAEDVPGSFQAMAGYLARDGGRWRAPNPAHDPDDPRTPSHYGLWFDQSLGGKVLELRIVAHFAAGDRVSTNAYWAWHPGRRELIYLAFDGRGGVAEGVTTFTDTATFTTVTTENRPNGRSWVHRDDNIIVGSDVHRNTSARRDGDGNWVPSGEYVWERERAPSQ